MSRHTPVSLSFATIASVAALAGSASAGVKVRTFTIVNGTGQAASSLYVNFGNTVGGFQGANTAEVFDAAGAYTGWFGQATATNNFNNPNLPLTAYLFTQPLDGMDIARPVPNGDRSTMTVKFPNAANPGVFSTRYRNAAGQNINTGTTTVLTAAAEFRRDDATGLCSLDLLPDLGRTLVMSNVQVWTGLTEQGLLSFDPGSAPANFSFAGPLTVAGGTTPLTLSLGVSDPGTYAMVTYALSYQDDGGSIEWGGDMMYGSQVPAPGAAVLLGLSALALRRRRR